MPYKKQHKELEYLAGSQEVRDIIDPFNKAVYILGNYTGPQKFTKRGICSYFKIDRKCLKRRFCTTLIGFESFTGTRIPYLAPKHERELADLIDLSNQKLNSKIVDEVMTMVPKLIQFM